MRDRSVHRTTQSTRSAPPLDPDVVEVLRRRAADVADRAVTAIIEEVPSYTGALSGQMGDHDPQRRAAGARRLPHPGHAGDAGTPMAPALEGAYQLGRGEARSGRSAEALLAAYRIGARVSWRDMSRDGGGAAASTPPSCPASPSSSSPTSTSSPPPASPATPTSSRRTGRLRQRNLDRLARALLTGAAPTSRRGRRRARRLGAAGGPDRDPAPGVAGVRTRLTALDAATLQPPDDLPGLPDGSAALLVPSTGSATSRRSCCVPCAAPTP